jgi:hypothetical protein
LQLNPGSKVGSSPGCGVEEGAELISKHWQFINLVEENSLHITIFISNITANVR